MIIDMHAHASAFPKIKSSFNDKLLLSCEELISIMDHQGIDLAVLLPFANAESPYELQSMGEIMYICESYPSRFIPFCNIDPRRPKNPENIIYSDFMYVLEQYKAIGCKGVGEVTARIPWNYPAMIELLKACDNLILPFTFHTTTKDQDCYGIIDEIGLPLLETVVSKFQNITFLGHSAPFWSEISGDIKDLEEKNGYPNTSVKPNGRVPELMRKYPNLYGDLSANSGLNALKRDIKHACEFMDEFQDRLVLGFDNCNYNVDPMPHINWFKEALNEKIINKKIYDKITWQNANKILNLGLINDNLSRDKQ